MFLPAERLERAEGAEDVKFFEAVCGLRGGDMLVATPKRDYDDAYLVEFARRKGAVVISNDRFEDQVYQAMAEGVREGENWKIWFAGCRISFAFRGNEFIPNPTFSYKNAGKVAYELQL